MALPGHPSPSPHPSPHPRESLERCSVRADLRGDPMLGTAFPAGRLLLVEQPGPWGRAGLRESHFDARTAAALEARASAHGIRVLAIRRPGRSAVRATRQWALVDCRDGRESLRWGSFAADSELLDLPLDGSVGEPADAPLFLVCAHSRHDTCCALRGRPVAAALAAIRPGAVWECSHVGGDRFAANVLVLPAGLLYGRVPAVDVEAFAAAADVDEVVVALLRGRVGLPAVSQAALAFGYEHLAIASRRALRVVATGPVVDGFSTVRLAVPSGELDVRVQVERVAAAGLTCANPAPNAYLTYRPVAITPVAR